MQPDPTLQGEPAQHKAQSQASSSSICKSARILGAHPSLSWPTCLPRGFFASHLCWAGKQHRWERLSQARRSSLTFLSGLLVPNSITPDSLLLSLPGPRGSSGPTAHTAWERGSRVGGWARGGPGAWETLHKGLPKDFAPAMHGALRVGVCCWLLCLIHHRARGEDKHSAASRKSTQILPQHPDVSRPCKNISPRRLTARIPRWAGDLQINDGVHSFWFPSLQLKHTRSTKHSFSSPIDLGCC